MDLRTVTKSPVGLTHETPLLFVHGTWHGSWCWEEYFIPYFLDRGYECHALNFRGHGGSPNSKSLRITTIGNYVEDLTKVVNSMEKPPIFIAHSMGAYVVQHYLSKQKASKAV
jgi:pimeloyl-ACP methyl ester carboxylesterase